MSERRLPGAVAALIVASALVIDPWGWAAFGPAKWAAISVIGLLIFALLGLERDIRMHRGWLVGWAVFLGWGAVIAFAARDPLYHWIGTPDRHLGLLAYLFAAVAFVAGLHVGRAGSGAVVVRGAVVALIGIALVAILEMAGLRLVNLTFAGGRVGGPYGSPAYLGAACTLLIPIAAGAGLEEPMGPWRIAAVAASIGGVVAALGSQTRGAWMGLAVAAAVALVAVRPVASRSRWAVVAGLVLVAVVVAVSPLGDRLVATFEQGGGAAGRLDEWRMGASALAANAVVGTGFEGYRTVVPAHVDADYERAYGREVAPDRAHNGALDVGITTGVPGLALYVAAAVALAGAAWRVLRGRVRGLAGLGAGVVAYLAQQQFLFPIAEVDLAFWATAGVVVSGTAAAKPEIRLRAPAVAWMAILGLAAAALVAGGLDIAADHRTRDALELAAAGRPSQALVAGDAAADLRPDSIRYWLAAATVAAEGRQPADYDRAIVRIERALDISPHDPILQRDRATFVLQKALRTQVPEDVAAAVESWVELVERDPYGARNHLELGVAHVVAGDESAAESSWLAAADLAPTSAAPWANLARLYLGQGRVADATVALERAAIIDADFPGLVDLRNRLGS